MYIKELSFSIKCLDENKNNYLEDNYDIKRSNKDSSDFSTKNKKEDLVFKLKIILNGLFMIIKNKATVSSLLYKKLNNIIIVTNYAFKNHIIQIHMEELSKQLNTFSKNNKKVLFITIINNIKDLVCLKNKSENYQGIIWKR